MVILLDERFQKISLCLIYPNVHLPVLRINTVQSIFSTDWSRFVKGVTHKARL
jgi:hypothetical protein